jgi:hypothetical protein
MQRTIFLIVLFFAVGLTACSESSGFANPDENVFFKYRDPFKDYSNAIVLQWNAITQKTMQGPAYDPMNASRVQAMVHIAMHDALNSISPVFETYALNQLNKKADPVAAIASAAHTVLVANFPAKKHQLDSALAVSISGIKSPEGKQQGLSLGIAAGNAVVELRQNDNPHRELIGEITNPQEPGLYQGVPPTPFAYAPFWKDIKPFALQTPHQFRVPAMPSLTSTKYAKHFNEVKSIGSVISSTRSQDETYVAKFWYELSEIGWNRVTATVAADLNLDLATATRLFALVNLALADAYVAGWDSKFHHNFWRPYTAIRAAATDGNPETTADVAWEPLMPTPPIHDYPSTHSALGNAAAVVLNGVLGQVGFSFCSPTADPANPSRSFKSFNEAAIENANSRVLAGIHFRFSCESGLQLGEDIGRWTYENYLRPKTNKNGL